MPGRRAHPHVAPVVRWGTLVGMAITLPLGIRLAAGLLGTAIDRATALPAELPSMAVTFAGQALRTSMRVRQELADLATRGDELLAPLVNRSQEHPQWATFDEDEDDEPAVAPPRGFGTTGPSATAAASAVATAAAAAASNGEASSSAEPAVTLLDGTPVVDAWEPDAPAPGEAIPTTAGFVVGPAVVPEALPAAPEALVSGVSADAVVTEEPASAPTVANARRTTTGRPRGRASIKSDHRLTIAELKERTQQMSVAEVQALLAQEEAGPNRAAYLTLLGNRLMTLQHEAR